MGGHADLTQPPSNGSKGLCCSSNASPFNSNTSADPIDDPTRLGSRDSRHMYSSNHSHQNADPAIFSTPKTHHEIPAESAQSWNASVTQPNYTPQFSKSTALIVDRIKKGLSGFNSALSDASVGLNNLDRSAYEDARSKIVKSMNMSTGVSIPSKAPQQQQHTASSGPISTPPALETTEETANGSEATAETGDELNPGVKRKREGGPPDFSQNTMFMPPIKPKIVKKLPTKPGADPYGTKRPLEPNRRAMVEKMRKERLAQYPDAVPHKPELVGFDSRGASEFQRYEYFDAMKKTDLVNLLLYCDQIQPDLLHQIMVSVSKRNPHLPIFNAPDWYAHIEEPQRPLDEDVPRPRPKIGGPRHGPSLLNSKAKNKIKRPARPPTTKKPQKRSRLAQEIIPEEDDDPEVEMEVDEMPPMWPKAGEGLYAKLPLETEDREFLYDGNDEEAFSGFMVDGMGRQIVDPV